jgi:hypothetical protein
MTEKYLHSIVQYNWIDGHVEVKDDDRYMLHARKAWIGETSYSLMLRNQSRRAMSIITRIGNNIKAAHAKHPKVLYLCRMDAFRKDVDGA